MMAKSEAAWREYQKARGEQRHVGRARGARGTDRATCCVRCAPATDASCQPAGADKPWTCREMCCACGQGAIGSLSSVWYLVSGSADQACIRSTVLTPASDRTARVGLRRVRVQAARPCSS